MKKFIFAAILLVSLSIGAYGVYVIMTEDDVSVSSEASTDLERIRPRKMRFKEVGPDYFVIEWETDDSVSGYVKYGDISNSLNLIAQDVKGTVPVKNHRVRVDNLVPGKKYYVWVMSDNVAFGREGRALEVLTLTESGRGQ